MFHRALALLGVLTTLAPAPARSGEAPLPSHLLAGLEAMEYEVRATESGLQAPNRAQDLRTWFGDRGVDIVPRTRDAQWTWTWRTAEWGRDGAMRAPAASARHVDGNRVEYRGADGLTEWYVNRPDGLEQGFTVAAPPAGNGAIVIVAGMPAALRAAAGAPNTIDFLDDAGTIVLRYGGLHAWDAAGRTLASHVAWDDRHIRIIVEDDGAAYPVTIDPVVVSPVWTRAGGKTNAHFGWSVCTAGDVNGDGYSDAIVGAPDWDGGAVGSGAAFVYHGGPNGLQATAAWNQSGFTLNGRYGHCVSTAGDVNGDGYYDIIVGEPAWTGNQTNEGRALVYHGSASGLSFVPAWTAEWFEAFAETGASVAWAGDVNGDGHDDVLVGIPSDDRSRLPDAGMVRVFHGSASGLSTSAAINLLGQEPGEEFGYSVCTAGDVNADGYSDIAVGSWKWDGPGTDRGRVQVWLGSASGITGSSDWSAEGEADGDLFGAAAATVGDGDGDGYADLIVGAPYYNGVYADVGKVYIYQGNATSLQTTPIWTQNGFNVGAHSGTSVGTPGDL
ncbi:MAG TPA: integrin alpha, partial [bacterium]|nr:integrin alpha [bacterium]